MALDTDELRDPRDPCSVDDGPAQRTVGRYAVTMVPSHIVCGREFTLRVAALSEDGSVNTSYQGTATISAVGNASAMSLAVATISASDWNSGVARIDNSITSSPNAQNSIVDITVRETSVPGTGSTGAVRVSLARQEFVLYAPAEVDSETDFTLTVQAMLDGSWDTSYAPSGNLALTDDDPSISISPVTIPNTGWSNGRRSVTNCQLTGSGAVVVSVADPAVGIVGSREICVGAGSSVVVGIGAPSLGYYGDDTGTYVDPDEAEPCWYQTAADALANFYVDTAGTCAVTRYLHHDPSVKSVTMRAHGGRFSFDVTNRSGATALYLRGYAHAYLWTATSGYEWSPYAHMWSLLLKFSESASLYGSGWDLAGIEPDVSYSFSQINAIASASGETPESTGSIWLPLPVNYLTSMSGDDLYVWAYIAGPTCPILADRGHHVVICDSTPQLEIVK